MSKRKKQVKNAQIIDICDTHEVDLNVSIYIKEDDKINLELLFKRIEEDCLFKIKEPKICKYKYNRYKVTFKQTIKFNFDYLRREYLEDKEKYKIKVRKNSMRYYQKIIDFNSQKIYIEYPKFVCSIKTSNGSMIKPIYFYRISDKFRITN